MKFIRAGVDTTEELRKIAHESEAFWGYDKKYMSRFDSQFNITKEFIQKYPVYIGRQAEKALCFWGILSKSNVWELEYFYVSRDSIGGRYGLIMWNHMIGWCLERHIQIIEWVTSPEAVGFYLKMGAKQIGISNSLINGREIPKFAFVLSR